MSYHLTFIGAAYGVGFELPKFWTELIFFITPEPWCSNAYLSWDVLIVFIPLLGRVNSVHTSPGTC